MFFFANFTTLQDFVKKALMTNWANILQLFAAIKHFKCKIYARNYLLELSCREMVITLHNFIQCNLKLGSSQVRFLFAVF